MANRLAYYLRRTPPGAEVSVKRNQVVELIGEEKTKELSLFPCTLQEVQKGATGPRSLIPPDKKIINTGLATFKRDALVEAINEAKGEDFEATTEEEEKSLAKVKSEPDPNLLPRNKRAELEARGLLKEKT